MCDCAAPAPKDKIVNVAWVNGVPTTRHKSVMKICSQGVSRSDRRLVHDNASLAGGVVEPGLDLIGDMLGIAGDTWETPRAPDAR